MSDPSTRKRPTQDDVARLAGVSQTVVSIVLNERSLVSIAPETRQRVLDAIDELGYVPNGAARSLRTRRTQLIASLIPDIANPFYPAFERGIQDVVDARGYDLTAYNTDEVREKELRSIRSVQRARVEGVIATPFQVAPDDFAPLLTSGVPVVIFGELTEDVAAPHLAIDYIYVNDAAATRQLLEYLIGRDYLPLAAINSASTSHRREYRIRAYFQLLAERQLPQEPILAHSPDHTDAGGYVAMRQLLTRSPRPRAVFATNDMMAVGAMMAIRDAGLRIPQDVAVAGYDDITIARLLHPPLTTVAQFPERLGRRAAEMLFERIESAVTGEGRRVEMPHELMIRESA